MHLRRLTISPLVPMLYPGFFATPVKLEIGCRELQFPAPVRPVLPGTAWTVRAVSRSTCDFGFDAYQRNSIADRPSNINLMNLRESLNLAPWPQQLRSLVAQEQPDDVRKPVSLSSINRVQPGSRWVRQLSHSFRRDSLSPVGIKRPHKLEPVFADVRELLDGIALDPIFQSGPHGLRMANLLLKLASVRHDRQPRSISGHRFAAAAAIAMLGAVLRRRHGEAPWSDAIEPHRPA